MNIIKSQKISAVLATFAFILSTASTGLASDPWVSPQGSAYVGSSYTFETFDEFYKGAVKTDLPFGRLDQQSWIVATDYSVLDYLSVQGTTGYTRTDSSAGGEEGLADSEIGAKLRLLDEFSAGSPVTLSVGASLIIPGNYPVNAFPVSPGDGAVAGQLGLLAGKMITEEFGIFGGTNYVVRESNTPDLWRFNAGALYNVSDNTSLALQYRRERAIHGFDIEGKGFDPSQPQLLKEISDTIDISLSTRLMDSIQAGALYGRTVDGRNTGIKDIFSIFLGYGFN